LLYRSDRFLSCIWLRETQDQNVFSFYLKMENIPIKYAMKTIAQHRCTLLCLLTTMIIAKSCSNIMQIQMPEILYIIYSLYINYLERQYLDAFCSSSKEPFNSENAWWLQCWCNS
jgi:hypothetical protein